MIKDSTKAVFTQERGGQRVVYLDGRGMPESSMRSPTSSGFSTGHIEPNGTLVVETVDMTPARIAAGNGVRSTETHLTQRYIPSADGKHLILELTWKDPKLYAKPHVYEYTFDRMPEGSYVHDEFCDASDPLEGQSIVVPTAQK